ncbi:MAG: hypothetical protein AAGB34_02055, partial [Planctomycetota bacterium]
MNTDTKRRERPSERGAALVIALALVVFIAAISLPFLARSQSDQYAAQGAAESIESEAAKQATLELISSAIRDDFLAYVEAHRQVREKLEDGEATVADLRRLNDLYRTTPDENRPWLAAMEGLSLPLLCRPVTGLYAPGADGFSSQTAASIQLPNNQLMFTGGRPGWRTGNEADYSVNPYRRDEPETWANPGAPTTFEEWDIDLWSQMTKLGPYVTLEDPFADQTLESLFDGIGNDREERDAFERLTHIDLGSDIDAALFYEKFQSGRMVELPFPRVSVRPNNSDVNDDALCGEQLSLEAVRRWNAEKEYMRGSFVEGRRTADRAFGARDNYAGNGLSDNGFGNAIGIFDYDPNAPAYTRSYDRRWMRLPIVSNDGTVWLAAIKVRDTSGMVNVNVATQASGIDIATPTNAPSGGGPLSDDPAYGLTPVDLDVFGLMGLDRSFSAGGTADQRVLNPIIDPDNPFDSLITRRNMWRFGDFLDGSNGDSLDNTTVSDGIIDISGRKPEYASLIAFAPALANRITVLNQEGQALSFTYRDTAKDLVRNNLYHNFGMNLAASYSPTNFLQWDSLSYFGDLENNRIVSPEIAGQTAFYSQTDEARLRGLSARGSRIDFAIDGLSMREPLDPSDPLYHIFLLDWLDGNPATSIASDNWVIGRDPRPAFGPWGLQASKIVHPHAGQGSNALPDGYLFSVVDNPLREHLTTYNAMRLIRVYHEDGFLESNDREDDWTAYRTMMPAWLDALDARLSLPMPREAIDPDNSGNLTDDLRISTSDEVDARVWARDLDGNPADIGDPSDNNSILFRSLVGGESLLDPTATNRNIIPYYRMDPNRLTPQELHDVAFTLFTPGYFFEVNSNNVEAFDQGNGNNATAQVSNLQLLNWYTNHFYDPAAHPDPDSSVLDAPNPLLTAAARASEAAAAWAANLAAYRSPGGYNVGVISNSGSTTGLINLPANNAVSSNPNSGPSASVLDLRTIAENGYRVPIDGGARLDASGVTDPTPYEYVGLEAHPFITEAISVKAVRIDYNGTTNEHQRLDVTQDVNTREYLAIELANPNFDPISLTGFALRLDGSNRNFIFPLRGIVIPGRLGANGNATPAITVYFEDDRDHIGAEPTFPRRDPSLAYDPGEFDGNTLSDSDAYTVEPPFSNPPTGSGDGDIVVRAVPTPEGFEAGLPVPVISKGNGFFGDIDDYETPFGLHLQRQYRSGSSMAAGPDTYAIFVSSSNTGLGAGPIEASHRWRMPLEFGQTMVEILDAANESIEIIYVDDPRMEGATANEPFPNNSVDLDDPRRNPLVVDRLVEPDWVADYFLDGEADAASFAGGSNADLRLQDAMRHYFDDLLGARIIAELQHVGLSGWVMTSTSVQRDDRENRFHTNDDAVGAAHSGGVPNYIYD